MPKLEETSKTTQVGAKQLPPPLKLNGSELGWWPKWPLLPQYYSFTAFEFSFGIFIEHLVGNTLYTNPNPQFLTHNPLMWFASH